MIVVDTSAFMAVALDEPAVETCRDVMTHANEILVSAETLAEVLIVAGRYNIAAVVAGRLSAPCCRLS